MPEFTMVIRILVYGERDEAREDLVGLLETQPDLAVISVVGSRRDTILHALSLTPDVILFDFERPVFDAVEVLRIIRARHPAARAIAVTRTRAVAQLTDPLRAWVDGTLWPEAPIEDFFRAIRLVYAGRGRVG